MSEPMSFDEIVSEVEGLESEGHESCYAVLRIVLKDGSVQYGATAEIKGKTLLSYVLKSLSPGSLVACRRIAIEKIYSVEYLFSSKAALLLNNKAL